MQAILETPIPSAARTASFQSNAINVSAYDDAAVFLDITAVSGTSPSLTVTVQYSPDGTRWFTHTAFSAKTATGMDSLRLSNLGKYMRLDCAISGTSPSFTFQVDVVLKGRG